MATTPDPVFVGQLVQVPAVPVGNGGTEKHPGVITEVVDFEPDGGGVLVRVRPWPNAESLDLGIVQVLFCMYEAEARELGFSGMQNNVPTGCWPLDYSYV